MQSIPQFCVIVTVIETFLVLYNCNLLKILPTYILNYTRAYNLFWVKPLRSLCGHLVNLSETNKHKHCCYFQFYLFLVYSELCNVFACIAMHFMAIFIVCKLSCFTKHPLVLKYNTDFLGIWLICHMFVLQCFFVILVSFIMKSSTFP